MRVGLVVSTLNTGLSSSLWGLFAGEAERRGIQLVVFPHAFTDGDDYSLPLRSGADGFLVWGSSVTAFRRQDPVKAFLGRLGNVPYATIGIGTPGHQSIGVESHDSMMRMLEHLRSVHHAERILFLRGPEWHRGAIDRYAGYRDWLEKNGIAFDERLVSPAVAWENGRDAMAEVLFSRNLKPGRDFDAIAASSDRMLLSAVELLEESGYRIPEDIPVTGFNDGHESMLLPVPATTVRIPADDMARKAMDIITDEVNGIRGDGCLMVDAYPVIRSSCGCFDSFGGRENASQAINDAESFAGWAVKAMRIHDADAFRDFVLLCRDSEDYASLRHSIMEKLTAYFRAGGELRIVYEAAGWFSAFVRPEKRFTDFISGILLKEVPLIQEREYRKREFASRRREGIFSSFQEAIAGARSWEDLAHAAFMHLPAFSIESFYLVLETEGKSFLGAGFAGGAILPPVFFPRTRLIPADESGVLIAEDFASGYIVLKTDLRDGPFLSRIIRSLAEAGKRIGETEQPELFSQEAKIIMMGIDVRNLFPSMMAVSVSGIPSFASGLPGNIRGIAVRGSDAVSLVPEIRSDHRFTDVPVLAVCHGDSAAVSEKTIEFSSVMVAEDFIFSNEAFKARMMRAVEGSEPLQDGGAGKPARRAMAYIAVNYGHDIARWKMAAELGISEDYLERLFRRETGMTLWGYLLEYRIGMAERMLREDGLSAMETAEKCGFRSRSYFCRVFRRLRGMSPREAMQQTAT